VKLVIDPAPSSTRKPWQALDPRIRGGDEPNSKLQTSNFSALPPAFAGVTSLELCGHCALSWHWTRIRGGVTSLK